MNKLLKRPLYLLLSFTWGLPLSLAGAVWTLGLLLTGHKPQRFGSCLRFEIGRRWGGASFGWVFFTQENPSLYLMQHEHGHGLQNLLCGPLMPFLVCLPSSLRYHYRNAVSRLRPKKQLRPYDAVWFEGWATRLGKKYFPTAETRY